MSTRTSTTTLKVQVMPEAAATYRFDPFDPVDYAVAMGAERASAALGSAPVEVDSPGPV